MVVTFINRDKREIRIEFIDENNVIMFNCGDIGFSGYPDDPTSADPMGGPYLYVGMNMRQLIEDNARNVLYETIRLTNFKKDAPDGYEKILLLSDFKVEGIRLIGSGMILLQNFSNVIL